MPTYLTLVIQNPIGDVIKVLLAQEVRNGYHYITWDGTNKKNESVKAGSYFVTMEAKKQDVILSQFIEYEK